jgi:hypothetical protein
VPATLRQNLTARPQAGHPVPGSQVPQQCDACGKHDLSEEDREWAEQIASSLGPLTDRQRDILARLLHARS